VIEPATLAYVAGILDCQGGIRTRRVGDTDLPMVYLHGPNLPVLRHLASLTGTKVTTTRRAYTKAGCTAHCPDKHQHVVSESGRWSVTGVKATVVLWNVRPYLHVLADPAAEALAVGMAAPFKPATPAKMLALGWDLPDVWSPRH
jgi:hypothetical protein